MDYTILQVARAEHAERISKVRPVYDYQESPQANQQGRVQQQTARVLVALGSRLMTLGQRITQDTGFTPAAASLTEQQCAEC
jgi:hypothetical protein